MAKSMFPKEEYVDGENGEVFGIHELVNCIVGGPCMVIIEFVGTDKANCFFFTEQGVPFQKTFPLAILEHWEEEID